ncbi:MAG: type II toxin-antitoxin system RelE/ParE family toxin [Myxococcota bacterium]|jgi:toxin ParE1/3/4
MKFNVELTEDAYGDLCDISDYIASSDSSPKALHVLDRIEAVMAGLSENPLRGNIVKELKDLGINDFRELHFKPYRVIYRVVGDKVYVMVVSDGRRDMQSLLERRLLEG